MNRVYRKKTGWVNKKPKIIVILGKTATGKSGLAVRLARKFNGEIISADSRQVYRGLNIGTGKITKKEMGGVRHYLLDIANPKRQFSVSEYQKLGNRILQNIIQKKKLPIICGGAGFYIDSLVSETALPEVQPNQKLRKQLSNKTAKQLFDILKKLDPKRAKTIDRKNPRRLVRAIEIAETLGGVPKLKNIKSKYRVLKIGLSLPDKRLREKIHIRLSARMRVGMIDEARRLHTRGLSWRRMEELGLEYKYLAKYLNNKISKQEMLEQLETAIGQYAKRQNTWFKKDKTIRWLTPSQTKEIESLTRKFLN